MSTITDDNTDESDEEQAQYGGTEVQELTTTIEDDEERAETDNEAVDK